MKRITSIILTAVLIAGLAGCNKAENPDSSNDSTSTSNQTNATESTESAESTDSADSEPLSDDVKRLIEEYPCVLEFTGDDGTILSLSDIAHIEFPSAEDVAADFMNTHVTYGLAYMSYGLPIFATTLDNDDWKSDGDGFSNALDWLVYRRDEAEKSSADHDFFMVKPGDKLENGLVVKSAETNYKAMLPKDLEELKNDPYAEYHPCSGSKIEFDGTLTLEGILYKYKGDPQYFSIQNDVFFYPDTAKNKFVPIYGKKEIVAELLSSDVAVVHDDSYYLGNLGNVDGLPSVDYDVDEILEDRNYARVKITLKNICLDSSLQGSQSLQKAKIADVERLD